MNKRILINKVMKPAVCRMFPAPQVSKANKTIEKDLEKTEEHAQEAESAPVCIDRASVLTP